MKSPTELGSEKTPLTPRNSTGKAGYLKSVRSADNKIQNYKLQTSAETISFNGHMSKNVKFHGYEHQFF